MGLLDSLFSIVSGPGYSTLSLLQLLLHCLPVDRSRVMLATAAHVEQVDKILPALIQALNVVRDFFGAGKLLIVRIDLVLHPTKIFNGFAFARIESFDQRLTLLLAHLQEALLFATID